MLRIIHGNRSEQLLAALLESSAAAPPPATLEQVLQPELVLVPSAGMGRWLTFEIARRRGIACNIRFRFVAGFVWELFSRLLPGIPAESPFDPPVMAWRLYEAFGALPDDPGYAPLRAYLARGDARSRMDLAQKIAEVFALYLVYRPDWLEAWRGATTLALEPADVQRWQALLWRDVLAPAARHQQAHPQDAALAELRRRVELRDPPDQHERGAGGSGAALEGLPPVLRVFGVPSLAPLYVRVLARLAEVIEVEIYALDPCREYWADIVSEKDLARRRLEDDPAGDPADDHFDVGHPLLASWGKQARDSLALLIALAGEPGAIEDACFAEPSGEPEPPSGEPEPSGESEPPSGEAQPPSGADAAPARGSLLHRLQRSILDLAPLALPDGAAQEHDRSLQVHACHSLTRQLEVLHDQLLALFDRLPGLIPSEIVVMLPDLESAAPLIEAVFDTVPRERRIPFSIRGRAAADETPLLRAFATMLGWPRSRMEAGAVAEFLQVPAVARRFALDAPDLERVDRWLRDTGVRWGLDAAHRAQFGVPAEERHTLADGLSRLLLGYALPGQGRGTLQGVLPYDEVEGSSALTAGKLARALAEIGAAAAELSTARSVADWCGYLVELLERMFDVQDQDPDQDSEQIELQRVRAAIAALGAAAARAAAGAPVPCDVIAQCLALEIAARAPGAVPTGSVTFCGIGPLRGVPYRVVCMLGMDDGAFPRHPSPSEFDLMAHHPRLGDRARHADDRGSFLDALLAARQVFYLAYTGRSVRDNAPLPPSILVSELLDYLDRGAAHRGAHRTTDSAPPRAGLGEHTERRTSLREQILTEHRLQPFSPRYFDGGRLFSYARDYLAAAAAAQRDGGPGALAHRAASAAASTPGAVRSRGILDAPLPAPDDAWRTVATEDLARYLSNPAAYVLQRRLRIEIAQAQEELPDAEPFVLDRPGEWSLGARLLQGLLAGLAPDAALQLGLAGPELPHGAAAQVLVRRELARAQAFVAALRTLAPPEPWPEQAFELPIEIDAAADGAPPVGRLVLRGTFTGLSGSGRFGWRYATGGFQTRVRAWIDHLALCALAPPGVAHRTVWLCQDGVFSFGAVPQPVAHLATLLQVYWRGLAQPPRFMPKTASTLLEHGEHKAAMQWHDEFHDRGESLDPWYQLGFGEAEDDRIPQQLRDLAQIVVAPMRTALADDQDGAH